MTEKFNNQNGNGHPTPPPSGLALAPADAAAVDGLLGYEEGAARDAPREQRVREWLKVLAAAPVPEPADDLLERTLAAVQRDRMRLPAEQEPADVDVMPHVRRRWSRRIAEFAAMAVAASILGAVVFIGLQQSHHAQARVACAQNLGLLAKGLGAYAADNGGQLPALATPATHNWMQSNEAGTAHTNAANLLPAINGKYLSLANLQCAGVTSRREPAHPDDVVSDYSYAHVYNTGAARPRWNRSPATIVLADRNPLFTAEMAPVTVTLDQTNRNSPNHGGKGNYLVRADGTVTWETSPNVRGTGGAGGDNLWTVNHASQRVLAYTGTEMPASATDVFLVP